VGVVVAVLLFVAHTAQALEIEQTLWNFDGHVVPQRMNLLSVRVSNPTPQAVDATLTLSKRLGASPIGLRQVEPCYLSPGTWRWVQFQVLINYGHEEFELSWGRDRDQRFDLPSLQTGPPGVVLLRGTADLGSRGAAFASFPMELFPPAVSMVEHLHAVVLDEPVALDESRRVAFREWVYRGGIVHALPNAAGRPIAFTGDLSALQGDTARHRYGSGLVVRHATSRALLTPQKLADAGFPAPEATQAMGESAGHAILRTLQRQTQPKHDWGLLFTLGIAYVVMIGPVGFIVARKVRASRVSALLLLAMVIGFSGAFLTLGRRGYGERSRIKAVALAHSAGQGWYDVTQYVQLFVTRGDQYVIQSAAAHSAFSTVYDTESVRGLARSGAPGEALLDLPLFSQRELMLRARAQGPASLVEVTRWPDAANPDIELVVPESIGPVHQAWIAGGSALMECNLDAQRRVIRKQQHSLQMLQSWEVINGHYNLTAAGPDQDARIDNWLVLRLMAAALGFNADIGQQAQKPASSEAPGFAQAQVYDVFLYADAPATMAIQGEGLGRQSGRVLYHIQLHRPEANP
jgi:hypothetical protein